MLFIIWTSLQLLQGLGEETLIGNGKQFLHCKQEPTVDRYVSVKAEQNTASSDYDSSVNKYTHILTGTQDNTYIMTETYNMVTFGCSKYKWKFKEFVL